MESNGYTLYSGAAVVLVRGLKETIIDIYTRSVCMYPHYRETSGKNCSLSLSQYIYDAVARSLNRGSGDTN